MPHDFAKQREARASRASKQPIAPWLWFCSGAIIGAFCSFLLFLAIGTPATPRPAVTGEKPEPPAAKDRKKPGKPAAKPQFDFYTLLPESEVIVGARAAPPAAAAGAEPVAKTPQAAPTITPSELLLQAGSFRQMADADGRRADIILLGYEARVEAVSVANEGAWYRVLVGPFPSTEMQAEARRLLLDQGFDTLEISKRPK